MFRFLMAIRLILNQFSTYVDKMASQKNTAEYVEYHERDSYIVNVFFQKSLQIRHVNSCQYFIKRWLFSYKLIYLKLQYRQSAHHRQPPTGNIMSSHPIEQ